MPNCIAFFNGKVVKERPSTMGVLWAGQFSVAHSTGSIARYVEECLKEAKGDILTILPSRDGDFSAAELESFGLIQLLHTYAKSDRSNVLVATLAQTVEDPSLSYLYLPLDDGFFDHGVRFDNLPPWEQKRPLAFWRGGCSGSFTSDYSETARYRTVKELLNHPSSDAKLLTRWGWNSGKTIPDEFFGNEVHPSEYCNYKLVLIVDGNVIASSHMWCFGIGSVPLLISNAKCWFSEFLQPFVNYVPVEYDLSDLKSKINWLLTNDAVARKIAENALEFSRTHFSPAFQKKYVRDKIHNFAAR
jgi:hypothetical protein